MFVNLCFTMLTLQQFITTIEARESSAIAVVDNFESIRRDGTLQILVIQGDANTVDAPSINPQVFSKVPNIEDLFIINILGGLKMNIWTTVRKLKHLKIEDNQLTYIGAAVWSGLDLEKLSLRNNQIEELDDNAFDGLKVSMMDLSNNNLRKLPSRCLQGLRLYKLTLANNELECIDLETFGPELAYADLSNNLLTSLDFDVFSGVYALLNLNLSGNKLTSIVAAPALSKLQVLDYSRNDISVIMADAFTYYTQLKVLHLDHNQLFRLSHKAFPTSAPIKILTINNNYLTGLSENLLNAVDGLSYLKFGGNPWSCQCLEQILEFIESNKIGMDHCEGRIIQDEGHFCVDIPGNCNGTEPKYLAQNFDIYEEFIKHYQC